MKQTSSTYEFRFGGISRLYGLDGLERLQRSHVCVIGIGGVGSWAAESLARSGIQQLTLVDLDDVCESNINRQIHSNSNSIGRQKVEAMAERCVEINPDCKVNAVDAFFTSTTAETILSHEFDYVIDAIDSAKHKCELIAACAKIGVPMIVSGAAGGRADPTRIRIADLSKSFNDKLLQRVRKILRKERGFPRDPKTKFKVDCVFSSETATAPSRCDTNPANSSDRLDCASGFGAAAHVTGTFGFAAAGHAIGHIATQS